MSLRKRTFDFHKVETVLKSLPKFFEARKASHKSGMVDKTVSHSVIANTTTGLDESFNLGDNHDCNDVSCFLEHPKTMGAVTDEDVIRTRTREIKQVTRTLPHSIVSRPLTEFFYFLDRLQG